MSLCHDNRAPVPVPGLRKARPGSERLGRQINPDGLNVRIRMNRVAAVRPFRIAIQRLVEEALARQVMIDADDIGSGISLTEELELLLANAAANQDLVPGVVGINPSAKEVEAEPPALVLQLRLIAQQGCAEGLPEVLGLDELRIRPDGPNCAHR